MAAKLIKSVEELKKVLGTVSELDPCKYWQKRQFLGQFVKYKKEVKKKLSIDEYIEIIKLGLGLKKLGSYLHIFEMLPISPSNDEKEKFIK